MADYDSSLPVRSEADVDERVQTKIVDATNPATQQMEVDTDGNAHVEVHGDDPTGTDTTLRTSEQGSASVDGEYDASNNTDPSQTGLVSMSRDASPADSQQTQRVTGATSGDGTKRTVDISLLDEDGEAYTALNPLPTAPAASTGADVIDYKEAASVAKNASDDHDYTVTALKTLSVKSVEVAGSGKLKAEFQIETGVGAGTYDTIAVRFNSTASPNDATFTPREPIEVSAGVNFRVTITNRDNQPQNVYSTIIGEEN